MYLKGRNTILNYTRFFIPSPKVTEHYSSIKRSSQFILTTNNIKVLDTVGKIILEDDLNPKGVYSYLLTF